jgi:hypothetical protein
MSQPAGFESSSMTIGGKQSIGFGVFNSQKGFKFDGNGNLISIDPNAADVIGDFGEMALGGAYFNAVREINGDVPARVFQRMHMKTSAMEIGYDTCVSESTRGGSGNRGDSVFGIDTKVGFIRGAYYLKNHKLEYREFPSNAKDTYLKASRQVRDFVKARYDKGEY